MKTIKEFNLSEKIRVIDSEASGWADDIKDNLVISKKDIKEFIKQLKQIFPEKLKSILGSTFFLHYEIDKLTGDKLI